MTSRSGESDRLIKSMEDLISESEESDCEFAYVEARDAFFDQPLHSFVIDEVRSMLQILFCQTACCIHCYNPLYFSMFGIMFILTLPGALLHWMVISWVPVRVSEDMEEREIRCQGIYTAMGTALLNIPLNVLALYHSSVINDPQLITILTLTIYVDVGIIVFCLAGLKAITDELPMTTRIFVIGAWLMDLVLITLLLCDVHLLASLTLGTAVGFVLKVMFVFISTVVAAQGMHFWSQYSNKVSQRKQRIDNCLAVALVMIVLGMVGSLAVVVWLTYERGWGLDSL